MKWVVFLTKSQTRGITRKDPRTIQLSDRQLLVKTRRCLSRDRAQPLVHYGRFKDADCTSSWHRFIRCARQTDGEIVMARFVLSSPSNSALLPSLRVAPCELLPPFQALRRGPCVCSRRTAYFCSPCVCRLSPQNGGNRVWETKLQKATTRLKDATAHVSECQIAIGAAALLPWSRNRCRKPRASLLKVASICHKACRGRRPACYLGHQGVRWKRGAGGANNVSLDLGICVVRLYG